MRAFHIGHDDRVNNLGILGRLVFVARDEETREVNHGEVRLVWARDFNPKHICAEDFAAVSQAHGHLGVVDDPGQCRNLGCCR